MLPIDQILLAFEVNQVGLATDTIEASRTLQVMLESDDIR